jgi:hypothetical protein
VVKLYGLRAFIGSKHTGQKYSSYSSVEQRASSSSPIKLAETGADDDDGANTSSIEANEPVLLVGCCFFTVTAADKASTEGGEEGNER